MTRQAATARGKQPRENATDPIPVTNVRSVARYLILALLVLVPLTTLPPNVLLYNAMDAPRRLVLLLVAGGLTACLLLRWAAEKRVTWRRHPFDLPIVLLFAGALISGLASPYPKIVFFTPIWASEDPLLLLWLMIACFFGLRAFVQREEEVEAAARAIVFTGAAVALIGLVDYYCRLGLNPYMSGHRLVGTLGNPMFTGTYLATTIPLGIALAFREPSFRRVFPLLAVGLMLSALALTQARAAWIACAVTLVLVAVGFYMTQAGQPRRIDYRWGGAVLLAVVGITVLCIGTPQLRTRLSSLTNLHDVSIQTRLVYLRGGWNLFAARPVAGWGLGVEQFMFPQYRPVVHLRGPGWSINRGYTTALPHNLPMLIASELGFVGLVPACMLLIAIIGVGRKVCRPAHRQSVLGIGVLGALTVYLLSNLAAFDNAATMAQGWIMLALLAGMSVDAPPRAIKALPAEMPVRYLRGVAAAIIVCVMVVAGLQGMQAYFLERGSAATQHAKALSSHDPKRAWQVSRFATRDIRKAIACSPMPYFEEYKEAYFAAEVQLDAAPDALQASLARQDLQTQGNRTLAGMDREWQILRFLCLRYLAWGEPEKARPLIDRLCHDEPNSAEVVLLDAQWLAQAGDMEDAAARAEHAVQLDDTFPEAYAMLSHYQYALFSAQPARYAPFVPRCCDGYAQAEQLGYALSPAYRFEYATTLLLTHRTPEALAAARRLQGTPEFTRYAAFLRSATGVPALARSATQILAGLQAHPSPLR